MTLLLVSGEIPHDVLTSDEPTASGGPRTMLCRGLPSLKGPNLGQVNIHADGPL